MSLFHAPLKDLGPGHRSILPATSSDIAAAFMDEVRGNYTNRGVIFQVDRQTHRLSADIPSSLGAVVIAEWWGKHHVRMWQPDMPGTAVRDLLNEILAFSDTPWEIEAGTWDIIHQGTGERREWSNAMEFELGSAYVSSGVR